MSRVPLLFDGETLVQIAKRTGINRTALRARYQRHGHPLPVHLGDEARAERKATAGAAKLANQAAPRKSKAIDITGRVFGQLTVLQRDGVLGKDAAWRCQCTCGAIARARSGNLRSGLTASCGCAKLGLILAISIGQVFDRLTVTASAARGKRGVERWEVRCSCGTIKTVDGASLRRPKGDTLSCGCARAEKGREHMRALGKRSSEWSTGRTVTTILPGTQFGRLTVIERDLSRDDPTKTNGRAAFWRCSCSCGETKVTRSDSLLQGWTKSCGCLAKKRVAERNQATTTARTPGKAAA